MTTCVAEICGCVNKDNSCVGLKTVIVRIQCNIPDDGKYKDVDSFI